MQVISSHISCGIHEIEGLGRFEKANKDQLKRYTDSQDTHGRPAMYILSTNKAGYTLWDSYLKELGFKKCGRSPVNPNSRNRIRLYVRQIKG